MRESVDIAIRPSTRLTSVDVPPMSKDTMRRKPAASATTCAPTTPAAGPDNTVRTASARASDEEIDPPFDCMMLRRRPPSCASSRPRYRSISGATYALTTVVHHRSNSRYSGSTSDDTDTSHPSRRNRSATRCSCAGLT